MSTTLAGPVLIACATLALAGGAKLVGPGATGRSLAAVGLPHHPWLVQGLGAAEILLGAATVVVGGHVLPAITGVAYLAFAVFVVAARRSRTATSCGCFGAAETPPSTVHVVVNLAIAAACAAAAITGLAPIATVLDDQPALGLPFLAFAAMGTYATVLALTVLPRVVEPQAAVAPAFHLTDQGQLTTPGATST